MLSAIEPLGATATLAGAVFAFGERFDGAYLLLALFVFAMTYPGSLVRRGEAGAVALAVDVLTGWIPVVALLALLG